MVWAEFEEKEYEVAFAIELGSGAVPSPVFSSGTVTEKVLGYDAAADPQKHHEIWRLLKIERPKGIRLFPDFWHLGQEPPLNRLPVAPISIVLQYKRPEFLKGGAAKQWERWRQPYYRFERYDEQHSILRRIESALGSEAVVRYATPAFHLRGEYERAVMQRQVLGRTGFVSPKLLGNHKVWTYREPGVDGYPNPSGRWTRFDSAQNLFQDLLSSSIAQSTRRETSDLAIYPGFDIHLTNLAAAVTYRRPWIRTGIQLWERNIRASRLALEDVVLRRILLIATMQTAMMRIGASWHIYEGP